MIWEMESETNQSDFKILDNHQLLDQQDCHQCKQSPETSIPTMHHHCKMFFNQKKKMDEQNTD